MKRTQKTFFSLLLAAVMLICTALPALAAAKTEQTEKPYENSEFFEYNELSIHYRVFKAENEKAKIFMIHGFAMSGACWTRLASRLANEGYTCVTADLPDFGYSSRENADSAMYPREEVMHALMEELSKGEKWYVAGHSMGGYIALALAEKYPESVKNLMLFETACNTGKPQQLNNMMTNKAFISVMAPLMELAARFDFMVKLVLAAALCDSDYLRGYPLGEVTSPLRIKGTGEGALRSFAVLPETNLDAVKTMPPILYMNGDRDFVIPEKERTLLRQYLPDGSTDITVKGGGHLFIENKAEETASAVIAFITGTNR